MADVLPNPFRPNGHLQESLFTSETIQTLHKAVEMTRSTRWESIRSPHLFMGLLAAPDAAICHWAQQLNADLYALLKQFHHLFYQENGEKVSVLALHQEFFSDNGLRVLRDAMDRARINRRPTVTTLDILISVLTSQNSIVAECFERIGVTPDQLTKIAVVTEKSLNDDNSASSTE